MRDPAPSSLRCTVLHGWHVEHAARMVPFGGWDMPVQYSTGITREHIATRTVAGLFDVSHMGRFRCSGSGAERFLGRFLTNDPSVLLPGQAHYTLLANENGGAIDDAYLYRLGLTEFLLVVNASNREKDWTWLTEEGVPADVRLWDDSDALAMIALQGPRSQDLLSQLLGEGGLPIAQRNRLALTSYRDETLIVARTGYTGEAVCFELFVPTPIVVDVWQSLVALGAVPAGLGARDSLRLEAGLPLYGHELGLDVEGDDIPIFANALARFGVRPIGRGSYVGSAALEEQRREYEAIASGACTVAPALRLLKRVVKPIAVFESRRPLRAGYQLLLDGEPIGYVTSGTSVPIARTGASLDDRPEMRPIGLALVRSDIRFDRTKRVRFAVQDGRGEVMTADLVERNLPPATLY